MRECNGNAWREIPFGNLCARIVNGGTPDTSITAYWNGDTPWITGADFTQHGIGEIRRHVSSLGVRSSATSVVEKGNLLVVTRTGVGKLAIAPCDIAISQDITGVYLDAAQVDTKFVFHLLMGKELNELKKLNQGTSINGIVRSDLQQHLVCLPVSKRIQRRIAEVLDAIDSAAQRTEALIAKYQQIKAGLMHDLFTRGVLPNGQLRPSREQAPELYQETATGWIPKGWVFRELWTIADVLDPQPDHRTPPEAVEGVPYVGIGDFDNYQELILNSCRKVIREAYEKQRLRFTVEEGDVIFGKIGTIGQPKRLPFGGYAVSANVVLLKPKIDGYFFYFAVSSVLFEELVSRITNTTSQPALGIEKIRTLSIPCPTDLEASCIGDRFYSIAKRISSELRYLDKLKYKKSGLMHDLLTGKVPVKVEEPEAVDG